MSNKILENEAKRSDESRDSLKDEIRSVKSIKSKVTVISDHKD
jgi:hypothetical protein